ncbi:hypothetical protein [Virgibacillus salexigens]|uniref:Uncharacterized protein n=1 Tax=Virgibacillus massiliensis TaxID=1462526 RepID=A0A024QI23_9BACI|nr:hypothetical protein [Virgibacillus massiliensis]CDQ41845.1 hypothetical protein BN990_04224 [Virgibacillus massiliensis]
MENGKKPTYIRRKKTEQKTLHERLVENGSVDLRNNSEIIDLGYGYSKIVPIDRSKIYK